MNKSTRELVETTMSISSDIEELNNIMETWDIHGLPRLPDIDSESRAMALNELRHTARHVHRAVVWLRNLHLTCDYKRQVESNYESGGTALTD